MKKENQTVWFRFGLIFTWELKSASNLEKKLNLRFWSLKSTLLLLICRTSIPRTRRKRMQYLKIISQFESFGGVGFAGRPLPRDGPLLTLSVDNWAGSREAGYITEVPPWSSDPVGPRRSRSVPCWGAPSRSRSRSPRPPFLLSSSPSFAPRSPMVFSFRTARTHRPTRISRGSLSRKRFEYRCGT